MSNGPVNQPTPGCLWYWDGTNWSGPLCMNCNNCNNTQPASAPDPTDPCYVMVECPRYGGTKRFHIYVPKDWDGKLVKYP